ncbi:MAG TPA: M48 family metallopeptidase [Candidatus Acidoferrales bacterium]|nr:M48 family metallopeptidase [Candidatus Acidoferrales bacterium]
MIKPQQRRSFPCLLLCFFLAVSTAVFAVAPAPELPDPGNPGMTRDQQKQLGLQAAAEVYKQMPVLPDSNSETKYIRSLGERLVATIPPEHSWPFEFHVIAQKEINAFALPGGPMFVNIGTIRAADNEAELAGVMAHEMAHVYMQHSAKQQEKNSLLGGLAGLAGALAGMGGGAWGSLAQAGIQFGAGTLMLKYSRGDEAQADAVGAIILWKAGYNPVALADFFQKIEAQGGTGPQFLSDHPNPGNRRVAIENEIRDWPVKHYSGNSPEFAKVRKDAATVPAYTAQEIADGAKTGRWAAENRKNGAVLAGAPSAETATASASMPAVPYSQVEPSENFRTANLGVISIDRPQNWQVSGGGQSATIAPSAGASDAGVAYGVVIRSEQAPAANMDATQLTSVIVQSLRSGDPNMKQVGDAEPLTVDGNAAASTELETISPMPGPDGKPQRERDWLVAVPRGRTAVFLVFVSTLSDYDRLRPTFERMLDSIQF